MYSLLYKMTVGPTTNDASVLNEMANMMHLLFTLMF